ncbi:MAG: hypothetical protein HY900_06375 [Deltaproteobacteria bacterium]|nr:hypothetical protein [Deltaproteobacteria bacterium]
MRTARDRVGSTSDHLDVKNGANYVRYATGMAVEVSAVATLMGIGFLISVLAVWVG